MTHPETKEFYRYEAETQTSGFGGFVTVRLVLHTYNLHKETPKGYWIGHGYYTPQYLRSSSRWVSKDGRKRYAYPTKEEALTNYIKRSEKRVKILKGQLSRTEAGLEEAKKLENEFAELK